MNRREFIHHLALLAAGVTALPSQIEAFERAYTINSPKGVERGLISVDEIYIGGTSPGTSIPATFEFFTGDQQQLALAINLLGGIVRWVAPAHHGIPLTTAKDFRWKVTVPPQSRPTYTGHIRYVDQDGIWRSAQFDEGFGTTLASIETVSIAVGA